MAGRKEGSGGRGWEGMEGKTGNGERGEIKKQLECGGKERKEKEELNR